MMSPVDNGWSDLVIVVSSSYYLLGVATRTVNNPPWLRVSTPHLDLTEASYNRL